MLSSYRLLAILVFSQLCGFSLGDSRIAPRISSNNDISNVVVARDIDVRNIEVPRDTQSDLMPLLKTDQKCHANKNFPPKRDLEKRTNPSDVLWQNGAAVVADMGNAVPLRFGDNGIFAIGTNGLCGCTALAIIGTTNAVVAHFSPNENQLQGLLTYVHQLVNENLVGQAVRVIFSPPALNGVTMVQPFQDKITKYLTDTMKFTSIQPFPYVYNPTGGPRDGTLVVVMAGFIAAYLDNHLI